jgi:ribosomal protein S27E
MAIVECASCGSRVFLLRGAATAVRCPRCEEPLVREEAGAEVERRVRERLYGAGGRRAGSGSPHEKHRAE